MKYDGVGTRVPVTRPPRPRPERNPHLGGNLKPKVLYRSLEAAQVAADRLGRIRSCEFDPYRCDGCGFYHVGTRNKPGQEYQGRDAWNQIDELGDRAAMVMAAENSGPAGKRVAAIVKNARKAEMRAAMKVRPQKPRILP